MCTHKTLNAVRAHDRQLMIYVHTTHS